MNEAYTIEDLKNSLIAYGYQAQVFDFKQDRFEAN